TMACFLFLLSLGACIRISQSSTCHAQCDYDHVTARADCSSRNLNCIPVNYPDSLVMDLSHNAISVLEPDDFNGTFTRLVELYLDYNDISDVTSLLESTGLGSLQKLSLQHNVISALQTSCSLSSLVNISVDYNSLVHLIYIPSCGALEYFSANFNPLTGFFLPTKLPSILSLQFTKISGLVLTRDDVGTLLLDNNEISSFSFTGDTFNLVSLSHNRLSTCNLRASFMFELNIASNGLKDFKSVKVHLSKNKDMNKLDISNNSFDSLIQPDWAEGLQILYADDNMLANLSSTTLQGFSSLTELHLANNRLVFISPTALSQLTKLLYLYIAGNRLVHVHSEMFRQVPGLTTMDFSENKLEVFDITNCLPSNLSNLLLAYNSIHNISLILGHCDKLVVLDLSFNQIEVVPGDSLTGGHRALSRLELEGNLLQCDCRLTGLRDWLRNNPPSVIPRCQGPPQNSGAVVTDLELQSCEPPKAVTNANHLNLIVGLSATLSCAATGIPTPNRTWLNPNGTVIPDEWQGRFIISSDMTLLIILVELSDQGIYTCLVQNILGEMDRAVVILTVTQDQISTGMPKVGTSLAAVVLPTMVITIAIMFIVFVLVFCLRRGYTKRHQTSSASLGPQKHELAVTFRRGKASNSDGVYVNDVVDDRESPTAIQRAGSNDGYQDTIRTDEPPQVYQELLLENKDDIYEPVAVGGNQS
ncbi:leucine-rich repeats and immunoglobulin-like domains protein 2, partial [Patiria miniata]|uniref:Ig-like domain-containing protein n=1 Tax=Patiria miniata TaxID=46514 RepID=A0A914AXM6_PATMI